MPRALHVVDAASPADVLGALRDALAGGPAVFPSTGDRAESRSPTDVDRRVALVVETSGSTGRPKRVALSADAVLAGAAAAESALGGPGQWLLALPVNYIAGINVLARSITAETDPVLTGEFSVGAFGDAAASMTAPLRFTSLVPVQLARLLEEDATIDLLRRFDRILVGGQATPVDLLARALELGLNVTRTYGSAETCGGCVWDGVPLADTLVRIDDGRVELAGPTLAEGYLDDPARTDAAFRTDDGHRWYRTDDRGLIADGVLRVTGRVDDVIVTGGVKVSLSEVEAVVRAMPGQAAAIVVAVPSEFGESPVVVTEVAAELDAVRHLVEAQLGPEARPIRILLLDRIPPTATGKPDRVALAALALR